MSRPQATLLAPLLAEGVGLHSGVHCRARVLPAPEDHGLRFIRVDLGAATDIPVHARHVRSSQLATTLAVGEHSVSTTEHLLAALYGLRIDNARIELEGPEIPALDGSSWPWVEGITRAEQRRPARRLRVLQPIEVRDGARHMRLEPADALHLDLRIDFEHPAIGAQAIALELHPESFVRELGWARTFGFTRELDAMRRAGLGLGGSLENAVVFGEGGDVLNPGGLRAHDEPARHKALDLVGDLALLGLELQARVRVTRPGHALSLAAIRALLDAPEAWTLDA